MPSWVFRRNMVPKISSVEAINPVSCPLKNRKCLVRESNKRSMTRILAQFMNLQENQLTLKEKNDHLMSVSLRNTHLKWIWKREPASHETQILLSNIQGYIYYTGMSVNSHLEPFSVHPPVHLEYIH